MPSKTYDEQFKRDAVGLTPKKWTGWGSYAALFRVVDRDLNTSGDTCLLFRGQAHNLR